MMENFLLQQNDKFLSKEDALVESNTRAGGDYEIIVSPFARRVNPWWF